MAFDFLEHPDQQAMELHTPIPGYLPQLFTIPWILSYLIGPNLLVVELGTIRSVAVFLAFASLTAGLIVILRDWRHRLHSLFES